MLTWPNVDVDMRKQWLKCGVDHDIMEGGRDDMVSAAVDRMAMAIIVVKEVAVGGYNVDSDVASMDIDCRGYQWAAASMALNLGGWF